jgi:SAM-dependent methyltransferase
MEILEFLYAGAVFLSAFLLFQIQPIIAKMILPWFGGSSAVWSTCMLFFQATLVLGYLYAHWLQGRFTPRREALTHIALLVLSLLTLPIVANPAWKPAPADNPSLRILGLLAISVGLPYFLVSTTSSLTQAWYARTHAGVVPYRLFALSNFASMLALLSYPLIVEPNLPTRLQGRVWSIAYVGFAILCAATAWLSAKRKVDAPTPQTDVPPPPPVRLRALWIALAASASTLLLSVTTFLTQDVAAVPFLWILPLAVYLLSFILCFEAPRLYNRWVYIPLVIVALAVMADGLAPNGWRAHLVPTIGVFTGCLFICCMVCHGELALLKPHPRYLTNFYLMIALGGAAGGLFVGLVAPNFFHANYELPDGLAICAALVVILVPRPGAAWLRTAWLRATWWRATLATLLCGYVIFLGVGVRQNVHRYRVVQRNFYGLLRVADDGDLSQEGASRQLLHGVITHGEQMLHEKYRRLPTAYYCKASGIGRVMAARLPGIPQRIGVLGLGCGTLAAYGQAGDTYRIYEINPLVVRLANTEFTYLRDTPAKVEIVLGDGRLSLEREPDQQFDILVMDAFSGDSVPVHLVTKEAFAIYFRHLKPEGIVVVNVSNRYLDLRRVVERAASSFGKLAILYSFTPTESDLFCYMSSWVLVAPPSLRQSAPELVKAGEILGPSPSFPVWTDDFSDMWSILR